MIIIIIIAVAIVIMEMKNNKMKILTIYFADRAKRSQIIALRGDNINNRGYQSIRGTINFDTN